jgi:hypothetical protein
MTKFKVLGAVCLAAALTAASPVLARGFHAGAGMHSSGAHVAAGGWRGGGPGIAAGVIAGAALGGAYGYYGDPGYYGDSYAYDNGYDNNAYYGNAPYGGYNNNGYYNNNPNGYVCQPGTVFKGEDGRPHLCQ